jgi:hypothetical protein
MGRLFHKQEFLGVSECAYGHTPITRLTERNPANSCQVKFLPGVASLHVMLPKPSLGLVDHSRILRRTTRRAIESPL